LVVLLHDRRGTPERVAKPAEALAGTASLEFRVSALDLGAGRLRPVSARRFARAIYLLGGRRALPPRTGHLLIRAWSTP
jgi:hypothetical protein